MQIKNSFPLELFYANMESNMNSIIKYQMELDLITFVTSQISQFLNDHSRKDFI